MSNKKEICEYNEENEERFKRDVKKKLIPEYGIEKNKGLPSTRHIINFRRRIWKDVPKMLIANTGPNMIDVDNAWDDEWKKFLEDLKGFDETSEYKVIYVSIISFPFNQLIYSFMSYLFSKSCDCGRKKEEKKKKTAKREKE